MQTLLKVTGMHCASCKTLIEEACLEIPGVQSCEVDVASGRALITHEPDLNPDLLMKEIKQVGNYQVQRL